MLGPGPDAGLQRTGIATTAIVAAMTLRLDHLYRETLHWESSVAFWESLGFRFLEQWGEAPHRAGTLGRDAARIVLAEVEGAEPEGAVFLATDDVDGFAARAGVDVVDTHWGTRMATVTDPDGRTYRIEPDGGH